MLFGGTELSGSVASVQYIIDITLVVIEIILLSLIKTIIDESYTNIH